MTNVKYIKVKYHGAGCLHPIHKSDVGDWIDLYTAEAVDMSGGDYKEISLGVSMQLPHDYEAIIAPRSSTFKKYGIIMVNGIGIIDESYCGDNDIWRFPAFCLKSNVHIPAGTRICQFRIIRHMPANEILVSTKLRNKDRGGIGSTGD